MNSLLRKYLKGDVTLWVAFLGLCIISTIELYSASSTLAFKASSHTTPILRHVAFLGLGAIIAFFVHLIPYKYIRFASYIGLLFSLITLVLVLFTGKSENDATRWLEIGGFQFQPSELAKLSLIIIAADVISRIKDSKLNERKLFWILITVSAVICALILPENFSTAALLGLIIFFMMYIGKVQGKRLLAIAVVIVAAALIGYSVIKVVPEEKMPDAFHRAYTWVNRIDRKLFADEDPALKYVINDENLQVQHGKIAIARGGITGVMPGNSVQRDFLPQAYSDFIYAIIVEELGLIGGIVVILLYMILLFRAGRIATLSKTVFPAILVIGLSLMIVTQAFVSMAVATSFGPVTGQPLPMISRGGTSILITSIYFGILFGISRQIREEQKPGETDVVIEEDEA